MRAYRFTIDGEGAVPVIVGYGTIDQPATISFTYIDLRVEARDVEYVVFLFGQLPSFFGSSS
jgi:hypothetical protein